ncbi:MAG: SGNH/GDSL hydrolase family protein [Bacteroidota bacterium]
MKQVSKSKGILIISMSIIATIGIIALIKILTNKKGNNLSKKLSKNDKLKFLFIGDSYTTFANGYPELIKAEFPNVEITKYAQVGKQTSWMYDQYRLDTNKYDAVFIMGGTNDIYAKNQVSDAKVNIEKIMYNAKNKGSFVVLITPPPSGNYNLYDSSKQALHDSLNEYIKTSAADLVIDFYSMLENPNKKGAALSKYNISDGLHLNQSAYTLLANEIINKLK